MQNIRWSAVISASGEIHYSVVIISHFMDANCVTYREAVPLLNLKHIKVHLLQLSQSYWTL